jgi:hypothetical protein
MRNCFIAVCLIVANALCPEAAAQPRSGTEGTADRAISQHHYSRIQIPSKETWLAMVDSVYVDTLIMEDKSSIRFIKASVLIVEQAYIGEKCLLTSAGVDGKQLGESGEPGQSLSLVIVFKGLGSLVIDTRGGDGKSGARGSAGANGASYQEQGKPGGNGGNGGNAGNLRLFYAAERFQPLFNGEGKGSVQLLYNGGRSGAGGEGGPGGKPIVPSSRGGSGTVCGTCPAAPSGPRGNPGAPGLDGVLKLERIPY